MHARQKSHHQLLVEEFMLKAQQEVLFRPTMPSLEVRRLRANLIIEEALETIRALGFIISVDIQNARDGSGDKHNVWYLYEHGKPDLEQITDGCCDLKVVTTGTLSACGIADAQPQELVDQSNLAKFEAPRCPQCNSSMTQSSLHSDGWLCEGEACQRQIFPKSHGPYRREDGKWIKPPYWKKPDLVLALKEQTVATLRRGWFFDGSSPARKIEVYECTSETPAKPGHTWVLDGKRTRGFEVETSKVIWQVLSENIMAIPQGNADAKVWAADFKHQYFEFTPELDVLKLWFGHALDEGRKAERRKSKQYRQEHPKPVFRTFEEWFKDSELRLSMLDSTLALEQAFEAGKQAPVQAKMDVMALGDITPVDPKPFKFFYTNHHGSVLRHVLPVGMVYGKSKWHPNPTWHLVAQDIDHNMQIRSFDTYHMQLLPPPIPESPESLKAEPAPYIQNIATIHEYHLCVEHPGWFATVDEPRGANVGCFIQFVSNGKIVAQGTVTALEKPGTHSKGTPFEDWWLIRYAFEPVVNVEEFMKA